MFLGSIAIRSLTMRIRRAVSTMVPRLMMRRLGKRDWRSMSWVMVSTGLVTTRMMASGAYRSRSGIIASTILRFGINHSSREVEPGMLAPVVSTMMSLPARSGGSPARSFGLRAVLKAVV